MSAAHFKCSDCSDSWLAHDFNRIATANVGYGFDLRPACTPPPQSHPTMQPPSLRVPPPPHAAPLGSTGFDVQSLLMLDSSFTLAVKSGDISAACAAASRLVKVTWVDCQRSNGHSEARLHALLLRAECSHQRLHEGEHHSKDRKTVVRGSSAQLLRTGPNARRNVGAGVWVGCRAPHERTLRRERMRNASVLANAPCCAVGT